MAEMTKSRWGRMRSGGSSAKLLSVSIVGGLVVSLALGLLVAAIGDSEKMLANFLGIGLAMWPVAVAVLWFVLVDRDSLEKAPKSPEDSVESRWAEQANAAVCRDLFLLLGLGCAVLSLLQVTMGWFLRMPLNLALLIVMVIVILDFGIRYQLIKRREG